MVWRSSVISEPHGLSDRGDVHMVYTEKRSSFWLTLVVALTLAYFAVLPVHGSETVNINRADVNTLASQLVGVGPQLAKRIVEFRERSGAFKSVEAVSDVRGIGTVLLEKNEQRIVLE